MGVEFRWEEGEYRTPLVSPPPPRRWPRRLLLIVGCLLLLALAVAGVVLWNRAQAGLRAARSDLQAVVDAELAALQRGDQEVYLSLQDFNNRQWYRFQEIYLKGLQQAGEDEVSKQIGALRIVDLDLAGDSAWVEVEYELEGVPYRRVQFYRLTAGHWRRTAPDERYWGERREAETTHVRFIYRQREEEIIQSVREEAERFYQQACADFGLPVYGQQVTFEFQPVAKTSPALTSRGYFFVPSPLLLGVRADGQPDGELLAGLAHSIALHLAVEKSGFYVQQPGPGGNWVLLNGIVAREVEQRYSGAALPAQWQQWLQEAAAQNDLPPLSSLWPPYEFDSEREGGLAFAQAESAVAYAVERGGRTVLPALLDALGRKLPAEETFQAALDMSLADFEAGWREFVLNSYPTR
ncbi:MAG: hypothetical protein QHJ81_02630 [Anaerolineae bacterium]|nr:hypothetical protein [Anaerolineae bacterium]